MSMPAVEPRRWTYDEVWDLIDAQEDRSIRYEYAGGQLLVTPAPSGYHQRIILDLYRIIDPYVRGHALGEVRLGPSPIAVAPRTIFQPDLYVVPSVNGRRPRADVPVTSSILIVEVLSPGSIRHDRITKRKHYQRAGVPEYWILDQESQAFERWRPADGRAESRQDGIAWHPMGARTPLVIELPELFRSVLDDAE